MSGDNPGGVPTPDGAALIRAQIARNRQQARYFRKKAKRLDEAESGKRRQLTFMDMVAFAGAATAIVSVLAGFYATRSSISEMQRSRDDAAFYEALKRMGDKDSPVVRASAAELLATQAESRAYYAAARSQLLHSLLLENDRVVLGAIEDACIKLMDIHASDMRPRLEKVSEKLKVQVLDALAGFTLDKSGEVPERISDDNWLTIESLLPQTGLTRRDLELLIEERERTFLASQIAASAALSKMNEDERTAAIAGYRREMQAAALRLRMARGALAEP
jgi:hypothetical protein